MTTVELAGVDWKLTRLGDMAVVVAEPRRQPSLTLTADGRVAGFDGCNRFAGSYQVTGRSIAFGQMASTKMACLDGMEHERAFADALGRARSFRSPALSSSSPTLTVRCLPASRPEPHPEQSGAGPRTAGPESLARPPSRSREAASQ